MGHVLSALITGAKIKDFQIFPTSSVLLEMDTSISKMDFLLIGISGMLLPFLISFAISIKSFWQWYTKITLRLMCIISFICGIISIFAYKKGNPIQNDDITIILINFPQHVEMCFVMLALLLAMSVIMLVKDFIMLNNKKIYGAF